MRMLLGPRDDATSPHARLLDRAPPKNARRLTSVADLVRVVLLATAAVWLIAGDGPAALKALLVLPAALLGRVVRIHPGFDLLFSCALAAEAIASGLGAYGSIGRGDTLSHLVLPLLSGPVLYGGLVKLGIAASASATPAARYGLGAAVVTAASVLALGTLWELVEWAADGAFGTNYSQGYSDTLSDLLADATAGILSGASVAAWLRVSPRAFSSRMLQRDAEGGLAP
jgi:hypothetical protein